MKRGGPLKRKSSLHRSPFKKKPTRKRLGERDPAYLKWLRTLPCQWCGGTWCTEAAHMSRKGTGGVSMKASDYGAIPLCTHCHRDSHATGTLRDTAGHTAPMALWEDDPKAWAAVMTGDGMREWASSVASRLRSRYLEETWR